MIAPGSPLLVDHPFAWYAIVRNRTTGKERTYYMNGTQVTRELVAQHIATHYPNVDVITIDRCTRPPGGVLYPVPFEDFTRGVFASMERYGQTIEDAVMLRPRAIRNVPIILTPTLRPRPVLARPLQPIRR